MKKTIIVFVIGVLSTFLILGFYTGIIPAWIRSQIDQTEKVVVASPTPTPTPSTTPKPVVEREKAVVIPRTTKGGIVLGESAGYKYATVSYDYKVPGNDNWLLRASYDTRLESKIDFDEVSPSYERKVTVCFYTLTGVKTCINGSIEPGIHAFTQTINGKQLVYEVVRDNKGPKVTLSGTYKNYEGKTCIRHDVIDEISPLNKLNLVEKIDSEGYHNVESVEICRNGDLGSSHVYLLLATDERGNSTENTLSFNIL